MNRTVADIIQPNFALLQGAAEVQQNLFARIRAALSTQVAKLREIRRIQRDLAYLQGCDDRMLADIGLTRGQIDAAVRYGRYY
jgi:uncharacterized protein YjiS (DUF1127 family)